MERRRLVGEVVRTIPRRVVDGLAQVSMLPSSTDLKTSTHIRDTAPTEAQAVENVVRAFPGTEVAPQPDDAA